METTDQIPPDEKPNLKYEPMDLVDLVYAAVNKIGRNQMTPYTQFIMDWNYYTGNRRREKILQEDISDICPTEILPYISSVVHGLCERDGLICPDYMLEAKSEEEMLLAGYPVDSPFCYKVRDEAPDVCWQHNVFYEESYLYTTCSVLTAIRKEL